MIVVSGSSANAVRFTPGRDEDERPGRRVHPLPVELEHGASLQDEVELLVRVRLRLVVLVDDPVACVVARPGVDTESRDAEVVSDGSPWLAPIGRLVDLFEVRDRVPLIKPRAESAR